MSKLWQTLIFLLFACPVWSSEGPVVVLLSDSEVAYEQPLAEFEAKLMREVSVYNLHGDIERAPDLMQRIMNSNPSLILALGAKAAYFAKAATQSRQEVPVIFAMVLNWQRYKLMQGQENIAGIDSDVSSGTQMLSLNLFFPEVRRLGVLYSKSHSSTTIDEAARAAEIVGMDIVSTPIDRAKELKLAYKRLVGKVDALWLPTDPVLYTLDNVHWLKRQCLKDRLICIGQSDNIVRLGMLLAVNPDIPSIGLQAATIAEDILHYGAKPSKIGVQDPLGTRLTLNAGTAKKIGLTLPEGVLQMADEVVE
jgi:putative ABC transport system substrate-binding protein